MVGTRSTRVPNRKFEKEWDEVELVPTRIHAECAAHMVKILSAKGDGLYRRSGLRRPEPPSHSRRANEVAFLRVN